MSGFAAELRRKRSAALTPEAATITGTSADLHVRSSDLTDLSDQLRRHDVCLDGTPSCPLRACVQNERMTGVVRLGRGGMKACLLIPVARPASVMLGGVCGERAQPWLAVEWSRLKVTM